jgi:F-type H+-transporting ATPase subunit delta
MNESKISVRYAKALFGLAQEKQILDSVKNDISLVYTTCETSPEFMAFLNSPVIKTSEKVKFFKQFFESSIHQLSYNFINLVVSNKRETYLKDIARNFLALYRTSTGFKSAVLTSAIEIDLATRDHFKEVIRKNFKTEVDLTCEVNKDLLGGFVLRVEDQQIDASVASKLKKLKQVLVRTK